MDQVYIPRNSIKVTGLTRDISPEMIGSLFTLHAMPPTYAKVHVSSCKETYAIVGFYTGDDALRAQALLNDHQFAFTTTTDTDFQVETKLQLSVFKYSLDINPIYHISHDLLQKLPAKTFPGRIIVVESIRYMDWAISELLYGRGIDEFDSQHQIILGMDTEWRPNFDKEQYNPTCLLQLATQNVAILFRLNHLKEEFYQRRGRPASPSYRLPVQIQKILQSPHIHKVGLGLYGDIDRLRDDYDGVCVNSAHDIQDIPLWLRVRPQSLQGLVGLFLRFKIDKQSRTSNWEKPRLTKNQIVYAATDAWAGLEVYLRMISVPYDYPS